MPEYVWIPLLVVLIIVILILFGGLYIALKITRPVRKSLLESAIIEA